MKIDIRLEQPEDYRAVEELTREAFWGFMDHPTCDGEHLLVHKLRELPAYIPELDFVAEVERKLVGHIIYSRAKVVTPEGTEVEVINLGPISVLPEYKRMGVGSALIRYSVSEAAKLGYRSIIFYGHPDYYPRFGFRRASRYGITSGDGSNFDALMAMELYDGALEGISGRYMLLSDEWEDYKYMKVNLSVPKFDVSSTMDLSEGLKNMGATNVFYENVTDFTKLTGDSPIYLTGANQSVRVEIDEEGVKAAAYIEIPGAGSAAPPEEVIDFVLDRPFLFVITNDKLPLFAGCVNNPVK